MARVESRGIDAYVSISTEEAKPALASQEPALTSQNGFPGGEVNLPQTIREQLFQLYHYADV